MILPKKKPPAYQHNKVQKRGYKIPERGDELLLSPVMFRFFHFHLLHVLLRRFLSWRLRNIKQKQFVLFLSILTGCAAGLMAVVIKNAVSLIQELITKGAVQEFHKYLFFAFPLIGILLTITVIRFVIRQRIYPGIPTTLYAISKRKGLLKKHNIWSQALTAALTVGFGGSAGLEAPTVAASSAFGSNLGQMMRMNYQVKTLLIGCAAAGSMAAIFKAPVAAIVFAIEVIMLDLTMASLVPLLLASIAAVTISTLFMGEDTLFHFDLRHKFVINDMPFYVFLGVFTGLVSLGFTKVHNFTSGLIEKVVRPYKKAIIGGLILGGILFVFPPLYGEGYEMIKALIGGRPEAVFDSEVFGFFRKDNIFVVSAFLLLLFLFKAVSTTITLSIGGVGGIFAPALFMGSVLGYFYVRIINMFGFKLDETHFSLVGMAGLMAGILHAPLTAIFLIAEITGGYELFVPLMVTGAISYSVARLFSRHSIYTVQLARHRALITHNKDQAVLTLMELKSEIENDLKSVKAEASLGEMVQVVASSNRNIFPVLDHEDRLTGIVLLDDIRKIMFDRDLYEEVHVYDFMVQPPDVIKQSDAMETVMEKFESTRAWNLPVVNRGKYVGFVSKSKLFSAYRKLLQDFSGE